MLNIFLKLLIVGLIIFVLLNNLFKISRGKKDNIYFVLKHPFISYDEKMRNMVGSFFYDYTLFIKKNTPANATILIPPQGYPWPQTGNKGYLQYFLYPRHLVNGNEKDPGVDLKKEGIDYALLAWGESNESQYGFTNGWPKFDLEAKKVIYRANNLNEVKINEGDYHYDPKLDNLWGIIEIRK